MSSLPSRDPHPADGLYPRILDVMRHGAKKHVDGIPRTLVKCASEFDNFQRCRALAHQKDDVLETSCRRHRQHMLMCLSRHECPRTYGSFSDCLSTQRDALRDSAGQESKGVEDSVQGHREALRTRCMAPLKRMFHCAEYVYFQLVAQWMDNIRTHYKEAIDQHVSDLNESEGSLIGTNVTSQMQLMYGYNDKVNPSFAMHYMEYPAERVWFHCRNHHKALAKCRQSQAPNLQQSRWGGSASSQHCFAQYADVMRCEVQAGCHPKYVTLTDLCIDRVARDPLGRSTDFELNRCLELGSDGDFQQRCGRIVHGQTKGHFLSVAQNAVRDLPWCPYPQSGAAKRISVYEEASFFGEDALQDDE